MSDETAAESSEETVVRNRSRVSEEARDLEALSIHESLPEGFEPTYSRAAVESEQDKEDQEKSIESLKLGKRSKALRAWDFYVLLSILSLGGLLGVLARRGLTALSSYNGAYISGVVWSNFTACVVMGFGIESKSIWTHPTLKERYSVKAQIPLYVGLTTGFCGSLSSFSSMILETFEKTSDLWPGHYEHYPNAAYGIMEFLSVIIAQISMSIGGLHFGRHLAQLADEQLPGCPLKLYLSIESVAVFLGTAGWIVVIVLAGAEHHARAWTLSCVFAPIGVYSRFYLSKFLNGSIKNFPLGTFACNLLGTILLLIFNLLNRGKLSNNGQIVTSIIGCQVLEGLSDGYCGCFTTVSTFAVELYGLKSPKGYRYGSISIVTSFVILLLILGPYNWTKGLTSPVC